MKEALLSILKFCAFILLLPIVYGVSTNFFIHLNSIDGALRQSFLVGVLAFVVAYLFICPPLGVFHAGQAVMGAIFRFNSVAAKIFQLIFSLYLLAALVSVYLGTVVFTWDSQIIAIIMTAAGFFYGMHVILVARELYEEDPSVMKPHYFIVMSLVYVINALILAGLLHLIDPSFDGAGFVRMSGESAGKIYWAVYKQLFLP